MLNWSREVDCTTIWSMLRTCATGRSAGSWNARWIGAESENGATLVRTTQLERHEAVVQRHVRIAHLRQRDERLRLRVAVQPAIARVADDADDLARRLRKMPGPCRRR